ncbi:MAG TPA: SRPBCC family protein [Gemmatimonadaceae bacterium]|nr:SRPBCC family protein [Gemmatimonadaceae bacterium]
MSKPAFVYVTYIATSAERLWQALTSAEFTERYMFGRRVESTWKVGAPVRYIGREGALSDSGEVLEADPPRRLVFTWRVEFDDALRQEGYSTVTFELEQLGGEVKLTVIHGDLREESGVLKGISMGWPKAIASLKSLLETGRPLAVSSPESAAVGEAQAIDAARARASHGAA